MNYIVAMDVFYDDENDKATAAAVAFEKWSDDQPAFEWTVQIEGLEEYVPGSFYKRELPCLMKLLEAAPCKVRTIIVDGHVWLSSGSPGLGKHLHKELDELIPIIGIAKRPFARGSAFELFRGKSKNPLYVTVTGMHRVTVEGYLVQLHGKYRIPTLLKKVDSLSRGN